MWTPGITLEGWEKIAIQSAFRWFGENKTRTAQALGIAIRTLDTKLEKYEADHRDQLQRLEEQRIKARKESYRARGIKEEDESKYVGPGLSMESSFKTPEQSKVSLPERKEVQEVLPRYAAKGSTKRPSQGI